MALTPTESTVGFEVGFEANMSCAVRERAGERKLV